MNQHINLKTRSAALLALGVLGVGIMLQPTPAHAASKEKLYKGGAVALGVLGAYYALEGKTAPAAIAGAGAYYAYKKGQEENDNNYDYRRRDRRNHRNDYSRNDYSRNDYSRNDYSYDYQGNDYRYDGNYRDNYSRNDYSRSNDYPYDNQSNNYYPNYSLR